MNKASFIRQSKDETDEYSPKVLKTEHKRIPKEAKSQSRIAFVGSSSPNSYQKCNPKASESSNTFSSVGTCDFTRELAYLVDNTDVKKHIKANQYWFIEGLYQMHFSYRISFLFSQQNKIKQMIDSYYDNDYNLQFYITILQRKYQYFYLHLKTSNLSAATISAHYFWAPRWCLSF